MSKVMIFGRSLARASAWAPTTPPAGPGFDDVHRPLGRGGVAAEAAVRLHEQQARRNAGAVEAAAERAQVAGDDRHDIGVDDGRRGAFVFLDLRQHLEGDARFEIGRLACHDLLDHQLVARIGEGIEQADGDRLDLLGEQGVDGPFGVARLERPLDAAARIDPLVDDLAEIALDQRRGLLPGEVVELGHAERADLQHVAKALGRYQPDAGALVFEDGVGGHRRAVADLLDHVAGEAGLLEQLAQPLDDRLGIVADAGGDLLGVDGAVGAQQDDVGEGAADIDADAISRCAHSAARTAPWPGVGWIVPLHLRHLAPAARAPDLLAELRRRCRVDRPARGVDHHAIVGSRLRGR